MNHFPPTSRLRIPCGMGWNHGVNSDPPRPQKHPQKRGSSEAMKSCFARMIHTVFLPTMSTPFLSGMSHSYISLLISQGRNVTPLTLIFTPDESPDLIAATNRPLDACEPHRIYTSEATPGVCRRIGRAPHRRRRRESQVLFACECVLFEHVRVWLRQTSC